MQQCPDDGKGEDATTEDTPPGVYPADDFVTGPDDQSDGGNHADDRASGAGAVEDPPDGHRHHEHDERRVGQLGDGDLAGLAVAEQPVDHRPVTMAA